MTKFLFLLAFIATSIASIQAQNVVMDSISKEPIPFVEIYSDKGDILGTTDYNGEIPLVQLNKIKELGCERVYFHHINYHGKDISVKEFSTLTNISLAPLELEKINALDEVVVFSKNKKKYIKFTAYFRSVQFNNNRPQYYMDGIVEYYISNKNGNAKIHILQNRSLKDAAIKQVDEKGMIQTSFNITGVPHLSNFIDFEELKKEYNISSLGKNYSFNEDKLEIGNIITENGTTFLNLEIYSEEKPKVMKLFGTESILKNYTVNAIYNKNINVLNDLLYFKEYRQYDIKQKRDSDYTRINCINEVFLTDRELTDDKPLSKDSFYSFIDESNYDNSFWENIKNDYIIPAPKTVESFIKNKFSDNKKFRILQK